MRVFNVMVCCWALMAGLLPGSAALADSGNYEVLSRDGAIEFRRYDAQIIAEADITEVADFEDAGNAGFRRLAGYIRGDNIADANLHVSPPVLQTTGEHAVLRFVIASEADKPALPTPTDPRITLKSVPGQTIAALRYGGNWSEARFHKHASKLLDSLTASGVEILGEPRFARYNPPFMPGFARRNEVLVTVGALPPQLASRMRTAHNDGRLSLASR